MTLNLREIGVCPVQYTPVPNSRSQGYLHLSYVRKLGQSLSLQEGVE